MALFEGHKQAYGKYQYHDQVRGDGKIKGHGVTLRNPVSATLWDEHLAGKSQLGVIPINPDNKTKFGAIDIDDYLVDRDALSKRIYKLKLPLIQFRSKSGGAHLFLFLKDLAKAELVQKKLREFASLIGYGGSEIFPKQIKLLEERGDIGQWINMPYFDAAKTERYAIRCEDNKQMTLKEFLDYASTRMISSEELKKFESTTQEELPFGPPCLQILVKQGFPEGTRNQALFNLGIYAQKSNPDGWKEQVERFNISYMKPPLSPKEVLITISSLQKKEYNYACKKQPICSHCNSTLCRTRKYGVGESGAGMPVLGSLTKLDSDPPIWFIDVEDGGRIELSTEELQSPTAFQRLCIKTLNVMPPVQKREIWQAVVSELLATVNVIPVPKEATPVGQLMALLEEFCTFRPGDESPECLLRGLVYTAKGYHHFRMSDFVGFLDRKRFIAFRTHQLHKIFRDNDVEHKGLNIGKTFINIYYVAQFTTTIEKFEVPKPDDVPF